LSTVTQELEQMLAPLASDLERVVRDTVRTAHLPGAAVGLVVGDDLVWSHAVGSAVLETRAPIDDRTLFRIASITKTFTATAVVQLRDRGLLRLDDPLVRHVPEAGRIVGAFGPIEEITLRRLLTHTAGLPVDVPAPIEATIYPFEGYAIERILGSMDEIHLVAEPGTVHLYSNTGFQLLGEVVSRVSGTPYASYVMREITGPLDMTGTAFSLTPELASRAAQGYQAWDHNDELSPARDLDSADLGALGGLWSCVEDLARWISAQLGPYREVPDGSVLLGRQSLLDMHRQSVLANHSWTMSRGLGWGGTRRGDIVTIGHSGGQPGFTSSIAMLPRIGLGSIALFNGTGPVGLLTAELLDHARPMVEALRDRQSTSLPGAAQTARKALTGIYRDPDRGFTYHVVIERGVLAIRASGLEGPAERLLATDDGNAFAIVDDDGQTRGSLRFVVGDSGSIDRLHFDGYPSAEETVAPRYTR
jgi:CubicO group peptidase (beta-lactamase class C family)